LAKGDHAYLMTANILARLSTPNLRDRLTPKQDRVYLRLSDGKGHDVGIVVYDTSPEQLLPFLISSLKAAGYKGSYRKEDPSFTTQFLSVVRSFEPKPNKPCCHKCQQPLEIGQEIISVGTNKPRHFHSLCYESTFH
jgi:hypothetical protein